VLSQGLQVRALLPLPFVSKLLEATIAEPNGFWWRARPECCAAEPADATKGGKRNGLRGSPYKAKEPTSRPGRDKFRSAATKAPDAGLKTGATKSVRKKQIPHPRSRQFASPAYRGRRERVRDHKSDATAHSQEWLCHKREDAGKMRRCKMRRPEGRPLQRWEREVVLGRPMGAAVRRPYKGKRTDLKVGHYKAPDAGLKPGATKSVRKKQGPHPRSRQFPSPAYRGRRDRVRDDNCGEAAEASFGVEKAASSRRTPQRRKVAATEARQDAALKGGATIESRLLPVCFHEESRPSFFNRCSRGSPCRRRLFPQTSGTRK
jgi:hypothetical protein